MNNNFLDLTISEIHRALVSKKVTPLELVNEAIKRAKNDQNNAFEYIAEKEAVAFAKKLIEPENDNLLWGIPFTIKDNFSTKNIPTCASSNILKNYVPIFNATVVDKLIAKKAILIGKTTLDELAMNGTGKTGHLGLTFNPCDQSHKHIIGGSSCGSAATVAANIVPFSIGSDTGDSVRKPASYSGLIGFKPTWGLISRFGLFPFAPSLDTVGFFTRSVEDVRILLDNLIGYDPKDFTTSFLKNKKNNYQEKINKNQVNGMKIVVIKEIVDVIKEKKIVDKFNEVIKMLELLGNKINYVSIDKKILKTIFLTYYIISCAEATSNNANLDGIKFGFSYSDSKNYKENLLKTRSIGFSKLIKERFIFGSFVLIKENQKELFLKAKKNRNKIVSIINEILKCNDVICLPAVSNTAPKFDDEINYDDDEYLIADNHMVIGNFAGLPSITLPIGFKNNLPFGLNITGNIFDENKILNIAKIVENKLNLNKKNE